MFAMNVSFAQSQEFKSFRVDAGFLYGMPTGDGYDAGIGFYLHPKYGLNDQFLVGLKYEGAVIGGSTDGVDISTINSVLATANYYFNTNSFRPFVGAGLGMYSLGSAEFDVTATSGSATATVEGDIDFGTKFGFAPEVGFSLGHFDMALQYNMIMGVDSDFESKNYFAIKVGFHFGGGKK